MAARYTIGSGNWSSAAIWDGGSTVPTTSDTITITATHTVIIDCATAVIGAMVINGTLTVSSTPGDYTLNAAGQITFGPNGSFTAGAAGSGNELPLGVNFEIRFTTTQGFFQGNTAKIFMYGQPCSVNYGVIQANANSGQDEIYFTGDSGNVLKTYFDGLTANAKARAVVWITDGTTKGSGTAANCEYYITSIGAYDGTKSLLTISTNTAGSAHLQQNKTAGGYIVFGFRNIYLKNDHTGYVTLLYAPTDDVVKNCQFRGMVATRTGRASHQPVRTDFTGCVFVNEGYNIHSSTSCNLTNAVFIDCDASVYDGSDANLTGAIFIGCQSVIYYTRNVKAINTVIVGCGDVAYLAPNCNFSGSFIAYSSTGIRHCPNAFANGATIIAVNNGLIDSSGLFKSCSFGNPTVNTTDIHSPGRVILHDSYLQGTAQVNMTTNKYTNYLSAYVCSYNHNAVSGDIKAWSPGGSVFYDADGASYLGSVNQYGRCFVATCVSATNTLWTFYEEEFTLGVGQKLELYSRMQMANTGGGGTIDAKVELQLKGFDSFMYGTGDPLVTTTMATDLNLQFINQEYYNSDTKPVTVIARWMVKSNTTLNTLKFNYVSKIRG